MGGRVLIADDSAVARAAVGRPLRARGFDVEERDSVASAATVDAADLACALLDLELGDGLGTDVAERLRTLHGQLPIAFFTSAKAAEVLAHAKTFGPVFVKPGELTDAIAWVLDHR